MIMSEMQETQNFQQCWPTDRAAVYRRVAVPMGTVEEGLA